MIRKIDYCDIDFEKYNQRIRTAFQKTDYACRDFLDIVSQKRWFLLVYGDYEAVMPVTFTEHLSFRIIMMPKFCHYLGIFSSENQPTYNILFYKFLQERFTVMYYAFNPDNSFGSPMKKGRSYVIKMKDYKDVRAGYHAGRRRNIRHSESFEESCTIVKNVFDKECIQFISNHIKYARNQSEKRKYIDIAQKLFENKLFETIVIKYNGQIQSFAGFYIKDRQSCYLSIIINAPKLENTNIPSILVDYQIQKTIGTRDFDFMGSSIESIAEFNKRFGAQPYSFPYIQNTKKNTIKKLLKNLF